MLYMGLLLGGFPLQLLHALVFWFKFYDILVFLILSTLLILLFTVVYSIRHFSARMPRMLPFSMFR